jgi:hypothetical protein
MPKCKPSIGNETIHPSACNMHSRKFATRKQLQATPKIVHMSDTFATIRKYATDVTDKGMP